MLKHGGAKGGRHSLEYSSWHCMLQRCLNPNDSAYSNYGGRGITVCKEWASDFRVFLRDMGPRPSRHHTIERINNDGHYEPGNCRWATIKEQRKNTRRTRYVTHEGITLPAKDWAHRVGIGYPTLLGRLDLGWPIEKALFAPLVHPGYFFGSKPRTSPSTEGARPS